MLVPVQMMVHMQANVKKTWIKCKHISNRAFERKQNNKGLVLQWNYETSNDDDKLNFVIP